VLLTSLFDPATTIPGSQDFSSSSFTFQPSDVGAGTTTGYGLDGQGDGVRAPVVAKFFSLHVVHTGYGAHPASYLIGTGGSFPVGKVAKV
jgi:hypothetical protein